MNFIQKLLARYFLLLEVPESFQTVATNCDTTIVITQSDSIIIKALLQSFAMRREISTIMEMRDLIDMESLPEKPELPRYILRWETLHDEETLEQLRTRMPEMSISTFNFFKGRGPNRNNPSYKTKFSTLLSIFFAPIIGKLTRKQGHHFFIFTFGKPFSIKSEKFQKSKLSRRIKVDFFQNTRLVKGLPFQPLEDQEHYILAGQEYQRMVQMLTKKLNIDEEELNKKMRDEFYRLAADPRASYLALAGVVTKFIINRFASVTFHGIDNFKAAVKEHPVVLIPMHRSHFDYILLSGMLYNMNLKTPLVAAGMNLRFWPIGPMLARTGAFFIRRSSRQDHIHNFLLQKYVTYLTKRGHLQEFFIEGGRSRSGRMLTPKLGILNIFINAFMKGIRSEILFVPVSINYEKFEEVESYAIENTGHAKKTENAFTFLGAAYKFLFKNKHGDAVFNFGEAVSLAEIQKELNNEESSEPLKKRLNNQLASIVMARINEQINPCLSGMLYTSLMITPGYGLRKQDLCDSIKQLCDIAKALRTANPALGEFSPTLTSFLEGNTDLIYEQVKHGVVQVKKNFAEDLFFIPGSKRYSADYYKNSVIHLFFSLSLISIAALQKGKVCVADVTALSDLLGQKYIILRKGSYAEEVAAQLELFSDAGILSKGDDDSYTMHSKLNLPYVLLNNFEALAWVYYNLIHQTATQAESGNKEFSYDEFIKNAMTNFETAKYLGLNFRTEDTAKSTLALAIESSRENGITNYDPTSLNKVITLLRSPDEELKNLLDIIGLIKASASKEVDKLTDSGAPTGR